MKRKRKGRTLNAYGLGPERPEKASGDELSLAAAQPIISHSAVKPVFGPALADLEPVAAVEAVVPVAEFIVGRRLERVGGPAVRAVASERL